MCTPLDHLHRYPSPIAFDARLDETKCIRLGHRRQALLAIVSRPLLDGTKCIPQSHLHHS